MLIELFRALPPSAGPSSADSFRVVPATANSNIWLGRGADDSPALLVELTGPQTGTAETFVLRHIALLPAIVCDVETGADRRQALVSVLRCRTTEPRFQELFLRIADSCVPLLEGLRRAEDVTAVFRRVIELFRQVELPPLSDVVGLWGELLVLAHCADPEFGLRAWHADPSQLHDFATGQSGAEVKTTRGGSRRHHFSHGQLVSNRSPVLVVSVMVGPGPELLSVNELVDSLCGRLTAPLRLKVHEVVARTLGRSLHEDAQFRFSCTEALSSLRFFDAGDIPRVGGPFPPEVSDVHYAVELDGVRCLELERLPSMGVLATALAPRSAV